MKVIVGLSGGVDSASCAYLLKEKGYEVVGMTMIQSDSVSFLDDAKAVASHLGIKHITVDVRADFKREIMDYFADEYKNGRTPNPCSMCNPKVKWVSLFRAMEAEGADYVATGHYARIDEINGRLSIKNSATAAKDQTYALAFLSQKQLAKTLMPLGDYTKEEVREIATKAGIPVAGKADSQDICFIPDGDYGAFLQQYTGRKSTEGDFVYRDGSVVGRHRGIEHYTIGQRKGLDIAMGHPVFVTGIDVPNNRVLIGESEDLFTKYMTIENFSFMGGAKEQLPVKLVGKIRYAHKGTECILSQNEKGEYICEFAEPVRAITSGQAAVLYEGDYIFGGGIIK